MGTRMNAAKGAFVCSARPQRQKSRATAGPAEWGWMARDGSSGWRRLGGRTRAVQARRGASAHRAPGLDSLVSLADCNSPRPANAAPEEYLFTHSTNTSPTHSPRQRSPLVPSLQCVSVRGLSCPARSTPPGLRAYAACDMATCMSDRHLRANSPNATLLVSLTKCALSSVSWTPRPPIRSGSFGGHP